MSYTASQKYELCKIFLLEFTASSLYCSQEPAENHKSNDQALKSTLFPRLLWEAKCYSDALTEKNVETRIYLKVMQSHSNMLYTCFKVISKNVTKGSQFVFVIHDHYQIFDIFS